MAEVLGIIGSCVAIAQLVGYGQKFARELRQFSKCAGSPTEQLQRHARQAGLFWRSIGAANVALNLHCAQHDDSAVLKYAVKNRLFERIDTEATFVKRQLSDAIKHLENLSGSKITVIRFLRWRQYKDSILVPFPEMDLVQNCLQMVMTSAQLEACSLQTRNLPPEAHEERKWLREENRFLKTLLVGHLRTIQRLEAQLEKTHQYRHQERPSPFSGVSSRVGFEVLIELGESIVETGHVPETPRVSLSSSESFLDTMTPQSHSRTSTQLSLPQTCSDDTHNNKDTSEGSADNRTLTVDPSMATDSVSGYVTSYAGTARHVTAIVLEHLEGNIISIAEASRLDLNDKPQTDEEVVNVVLGNAKPMRTIGKVVIVWKRSERDVGPQRTITLQCYVVEHCRPSLILGKEFWHASLQNRQRSKSC
ncbi:hypothetical protein LY78DRAFT_644127 [Colletotrichum sublineola]|nr:hypothetical protein LY78DRAFT_644127 [Colletotrichum sublineola]